MYQTSLITYVTKADYKSMPYNHQNRNKFVINKLSSMFKDQISKFILDSYLP